jgi:pyruvate dehydrogenase E2 component (dihydrolipoamide acetyltransferase)
MARIEKPPVTLIPHTPMRRAIGERVSQSQREKPTFFLQTQVDCSRLVAAREAVKASGAQVVPTYNDYFIKIVAGVLPNHPRLNGWYTDEGVEVFQRINVGFAVATEAGVMLPTVFDADKKSLEEIAAEARDMTEKARIGKLRASLTQFAGFTISNIGPVGVDSFTGIISPPQTAILAIGTMAPRPVVVAGGIQVRPTVILTLTVDHRCVDGAEGAAFLADVKSAIEAWAG